jgi:hypothetical protein
MHRYFRCPAILLVSNTAKVAEVFASGGERVVEADAIGPVSSKVPYVINIVVDREENLIFL